MRARGTAFALQGGGRDLGMGLALGINYSLLDFLCAFPRGRAKADICRPRCGRRWRHRHSQSAPTGLSAGDGARPAGLPGAVVAPARWRHDGPQSLLPLFAVPAAIVSRQTISTSSSAAETPLRPAARSPAATRGRIARGPGPSCGSCCGLLLLASSARARRRRGHAGAPARGRRSVRKRNRSSAPGWLAPIEVVVSGRGEPMTSPRRMRSWSLSQELGGQGGRRSGGRVRAIQRRPGGQLCRLRNHSSSGRRGQLDNGSKQNTAGTAAACAPAPSRGRPAQPGGGRAPRASRCSPRAPDASRMTEGVARQRRHGQAC